MDKRNILLLMGAALLALTAGLLARGAGTPVEEDTAIITVHGEVRARIPLTQPQVVTIEQPNGAVNTVEITPDGAVMRSSTCENQWCVLEGEVTRDNRESRLNRQFIICLPNKVSVEVAFVP